MAIATQVLSGLAANVFVVTTTQDYEPGLVVTGDQGAVWVYGQASGTIAAARFVHLNNNFLATAITTASSPRGAPVAVSMAAMTNLQWGWFQRAGQCLGRTNAAVAAGARINTTATAGAVDDDGTVGAKAIDGIGLLVAAGAAADTEFSLSFPFVGVTI